jgi:thiamine pyrophosphate-dependent acetolactate synthase large subunit-like protein
MLPRDRDLLEALHLLKKAQRPLIIIGTEVLKKENTKTNVEKYAKNEYLFAGKGAAYARAEKELRRLTEGTRK